MKIELKSPMYPNFLKFISPDGSGEVVLSIGALNDKDLEEYAEKWKNELIEHGKKRRETYKINRGEAE